MDRRGSRAATRVADAIFNKNAPGLTPKTWYGMPAYAEEDGKVVCYFQSADKLSRYATFGFNDAANIDGAMWATSFGADEADRRRGEEARRSRQEGRELRR